MWPFSKKAAPKEDRVFEAVLSGLVSRQGVYDAEGNISVELVNLARTFVEEARKQDEG